MEIGQIISLRMVGALFSLLLFVQLPEIFPSGFATQSKDCGAGLIAYSNFNGVELFYINGNLVDKTSFCKALQFHYANHCVFKGLSGSDYCVLDLSLAELPYKAGRKILQKDRREPTDDGKRDKHEPISLSTPKIIGIAAVVIILVCFGVICHCIFRRKKAMAHTILSKDLNSVDSVSSSEMKTAPEKISQSPLRVPPSPSRFIMSPKLSRIGSIHLNMSQVIKATHNFSPSLQIGGGGFGNVFKAKLEDGQVVAIKREKKEHFDNLRTEFSSEVELLAKIDHRNLVKLLGFLDQGNERLIITEFVPNGTLREHLDGQHGKILDFNQRLAIAIDVAHGLTYLHLYAEKQVIHRDVKSSNILLTESMRAKVANFGFARVSPVDSDQTHISTKVKGTVGYLDPEYMKTYQLTPKSDVYSFGILLLEILTGRRPVELKMPVEERVTVRWAFRKFNEGTVYDMVDPLMNEVVDVEILQKMFALAIQCAAPIRNDRPDMKSAGEQLWGIRADYLRSVKTG